MKLLSGLRSRVDRVTSLAAESADFATRASVRAALGREDRGWTRFGGEEGSLTLDKAQEYAKEAVRLLANPLVRRGIKVRNGYLWDGGVSFEGESYRDTRVIVENADTVFSVTARETDEISLATEGCVIYLVDQPRQKAFRVPFSRLRSLAKDEQGVVCALLLDDAKGGIKAEWYYVHGHEGTKLEGTEDPVNRKLVAVYYRIGSMAGETLGRADLLGASYYAKAYKESLETAHLLSRALAQIAYKVTSLNPRQQAAVTKHLSGNRQVGATASLGAGQNLEAMSKAGTGVNFSSASPLAAMVAAALDIPLSVLLTDGSAGGRQGAETALEEPTFKALERRQQVHAEIVAAVGRALRIGFTTEFGGIANDPVHRRMQSLVLALQNGGLHQEEFRAGVLRLMKLPNARDVSDLPVMPTDNKSSGAGPLSDGTNDNRDNPTNA